MSSKTKTSREANDDGPRPKPPVISLKSFHGQLYSAEQVAVDSTISKLESSLKIYGCVCVPVSDLGLKGSDMLSACYDRAEKFFTLDKENKMAFTEEEATRKGYYGSCFTPLGKEPAYIEGQRQRVESFSCTRPLPKESCSHLQGVWKFHKNLFPDLLVPGFGDAIGTVFEAMREYVAMPMLAALEIMLSLPRGFLTCRSMERSSMNMSLLRVLRYTPQETDKADEEVTGRDMLLMPEVGISEHTDFEVVTVMHQDMEGLSLRQPGEGGNWFEMPSRPDVLTVILGDMMEHWTGGWLQATPHRVSSPSPGCSPRKSLVLFQAHDDMVVVEPLWGDHTGEEDLIGQKDMPLRRKRRRTEQAAGQQRQTSKKSIRRGGKQVHHVVSIEERASMHTAVSTAGPDWAQGTAWKNMSYTPITQGEWVTGKEGKAQAALLGPALVS
ncbi:unnamed protein product [Discosporangium mesarthrocarpum]